MVPAPPAVAAPPPPLTLSLPPMVRVHPAVTLKAGLPEDEIFHPSAHALHTETSADPESPIAPWPAIVDLKLTMSNVRLLTDAALIPQEFEPADEGACT